MRHLCIIYMSFQNNLVESTAVNRRSSIIKTNQGKHLKNIFKGLFKTHEAPWENNTRDQHGYCWSKLLPK